MEEGRRDANAKIHPSIWEAIDRLMALECRSVNMGMLQPLYDAARAKTGGPLCQAAALNLIEAVKPGDSVIITTGAGGPPWLFYGETDGPLGVAGLARALTLGYGAWPVIITEERSKHPVATTFAAAGVSLLPEDMARVRPTTATPVDFPTDPAEAERAAGAFLDRYRPAAMIVVEKTSPNRAGVIYSGERTGVDAEGRFCARRIPGRGVPAPRHPHHRHRRPRQRDWLRADRGGRAKDSPARRRLPVPMR